MNKVVTHVQRTHSWSSDRWLSHSSIVSSYYTGNICLREYLYVFMSDLHI